MRRQRERTGRPCIAAAGIGALALLVPEAEAGRGAAPPPVRLDYRVECLLDGVDDRLRIDVRASGIDPAQRDLAFELPLWGEWLELDEYYVRRATGTPPVAHDLENRFYWRPKLPRAWDGTLAISYELPIVDAKSVAHERHGLLPWRAGSYVNAYSANTLMRLLIGGERQDDARTLELVAPEGMHVACGWGGVAPRTLKFEVPPGGDNTALLFGKAVAVAGEAAAAAGASGPRVPRGASGSLDRSLTVVQFTDAPDRAGAVLALLAKLRTAYEASTGAPPPGPEHVFLLEPGMGGTHTDGAISMGWPEQDGRGRFPPGTAQFIAHESFHAWLPGVLKPAPGGAGDGLEWFFEGFTDYLALWHLAHLQEITPQHFADHLRLIESIGRASPAWGQLAFADRDVDWRQADAEPLAYRGGALLAFHFDVELRLRGEQGLPHLFRDLRTENGSRYDLPSLEKWCAANGLEESWRARVEAPFVATTDDDLVRLGYRERREGTARIITAAGAEFDGFFAFASGD